MEPQALTTPSAGPRRPGDEASTSRKKPRRGTDPNNQKRRCVSTACVACRRRKSKCDGVLPSCAACASVYGTECVYDPNSDHRRKGVYKEKVDSTKAQSSTLQVLIEAILNASEEDVYDIVRRIRTCDNLDVMAESITKTGYSAVGSDSAEDDDDTNDYAATFPMEGERDLAGKMGELRLENGSVRFIGGTSNLIYVASETSPLDEAEVDDSIVSDINPITSWTDVTADPQIIIHLLNMYWNWHYPYFTTLSRSLFYRDFLRGSSYSVGHRTAYCSSLLVNAMLALGCHFTNVGAAYATPGDSWTKGDHFFAEAKRLIVADDEYQKPRLATVQALALMSVREAGCGREAKGWVYSGMSFRMAQDLGLNMDAANVTAQNQHLDEKEIDARRVTFWGCFLFDKCWSNYLGRLPQIPLGSFSVPKYDVFPDEDAQDWSPYTDTGYDESNKQPSRTRASGLQLLKLSEISSDLLLFFYHPNHIGRSHSKSVELKKLSELHRRLEDWRKELPAELEPRDRQLPNVILMHMFFHLQYIHLFRPFLKYAPSASPLPSHVSPRRMCTANAGAISKLMRLYKKTYNLRQICNIAVYMLHSACAIHLLNLPEKTAKRDIIHGVKHLEEIAEDWLCGRRALSIISVLARKWKCALPDEAAQVLRRTDEKWGTFSTSDVPSPRSLHGASPGSNYQAGSPVLKPEHASPGHMDFGNAGPSSPPREPAQSSASTTAIQAPLSAQTAANIPARTKAYATVMGNSVPISIDSAPGGGDWRPVPVIPTPAMQFGSNFATLPQNGSSVSNGTTRDQSPNSVYAIDGDEWYLTDGVNWQSSFNAWNMTAAPTTVSNSIQQGGANTDASMYMFGANDIKSPVACTQVTAMQGTNDPIAQTSPVQDFAYESLGILPSSMENWDFDIME